MCCGRSPTPPCEMESINHSMRTPPPASALPPPSLPVCPIFPCHHVHPPVSVSGAEREAWPGDVAASLCQLHEPVSCVCPGDVFTTVQLCQSYLSLSSWAASGSGAILGVLLGILAASAVLSRPEAQRSEVWAWPDGMWLWGESPDKHASDSTDLRVMGRGASGASHVSSNVTALLFPTPAVPSGALYEVRHLLSVPTGIHRWRMRTSRGLFSPQVVQGL